MKYTGNRASLYVEEDKLVARRPIKWAIVRILIVLSVAAAIFFVSKRAFGDALPHIEQQNMERWLTPGRCDDRCCDDENAYAMIVIDRSKAYEMGGMDSILPGMKLTDDMFLVISGDPHWEFTVHIFQRENGQWKETFKVKMGVCYEGNCAK
jgi:hypothetical protein